MEYVKNCIINIHYILYVITTIKNIRIYFILSLTLLTICQVNFCL